mmetsp:Transcript_30302/g.96878  ORF Transcript_30302/g.96878 Transcript_30302/m.96878 type:complete len:530 (-) Transcript_30302:72-1661(-)
MARQLSLALPLRWSRWVTLAAGLFAMLCAGVAFTIGAIQSDIRETLGASEGQSQLISVAGNVGLWSKIVPGLVFDRFGGRVTLLGGALLAPLGYGLTYLAFRQLWQPELVAVGWLLAGHGSAWIYTGALFSSIKNFGPEERSYVAGALACAFGLSAPVFLALMDGCLGGRVDAGGECVGGFLGGDVQRYLLFATLAVPSVVAPAAAVSFVREGAAPAPGDRAGLRFGALGVATVVLVAFVCGKNLYALEVDPSIGTWANYVLLALLGLLLTLPVGAAPHSPNPEQNADATSSSEICEQKAGPPAQGLPLLSARYAALCCAFGVAVGGNVATLNVTASMVQARHIQLKVAHLLVILSMGSDTLSRLATGYAAGRGVPLTLMLLGGTVLMAVAQVLLMAYGPLSVASAMFGVSHGIMWTAGALYTGKAFGLRDVGRNFGLVVLAAAVMLFASSLGVEPAVYRRHTAPGEEVCSGRGCFTATHAVQAALGGLAVVAAAYLHFAPAAPRKGARGDEAASEASDATSESGSAQP